MNSWIIGGALGFSGLATHSKIQYVLDYRRAKQMIHSRQLVLREEVNEDSMKIRLSTGFPSEIVHK
jgi:hypothetical protein